MALKNKVAEGVAKAEEVNAKVEAKVDGFVSKVGAFKYTALALAAILLVVLFVAI